jgi:surface polysaccharide O-acyltransferase-like enzyme
MTQIFVRILAALFFLLGALFLPFGTWVWNGQGSNPAIGWLIYLSSVLIPWAIAFALIRLTRRDL